MKLEVDVKTYLKFALNNGFKICESKDFGMAKFCELDYQTLKIEIWNDRDDYDAILKYNQNSFNLIHLANFLNKNQMKYIFVDAENETDYIKAKKFLIQLDKIIESELDDILDYLFHLTKEKQEDYEIYENKKNFEANGF